MSELVSGIGRLRQLDGLRGVAVVAVVLFHTGVLRGGFFGVDLFFVLSGFVITRALISEARHSGRVDLMAFLGRRARRLQPAFLVLVPVVLVATWLAGTADVRFFAIDDSPWAMAQLTNWYFISDHIDYAGSDGRVFAHLWSIAVEWQFYLVWPVVVMVLFRRRRQEAVALAAIVAMAAASAAAMVHWGTLDQTRAYEGTDTRAFALLLGAAVATRPVQQVAASVGRRTAEALTVLLAAAMLALWIAVPGTDAAWLYRGGLLMHSALAAGLIAILSTRADTVVGRAAGTRVPRVIGDASYSIYLWHWPIVVLMPGSLKTGSHWIEALLVMFASVAVGLLSTRFIEDPIRSRARWARGPAGAAALVAAIAAITLLWLGLPQPDLGTGTVDVSRL
ncbi:acyltransferase family protein [Aeromicrobium fastidiosum]|uniref:acyltransferase family protein n=1 Tax=Aeromicrobium fastidiosum TaxID=52699 RepID=UPI00165F9FB4|nr:acyltransferase [Aeromicrobium fastidiosum]MBP2391836.1 peptidoglycan/LPS O-acetylase OafA/YrhL [Aeromicrobium fastidiosum]